MIEEYRRSLKMPKAEELLDLLFYRPIAFLFVKAIYRFPITPNQVTVLSMLAGIAAGWNFSIGTRTALVWGALWYVAANILDCSDGQLARLQQSGTLLGRVIDGVADYVSSVAVFLGVGIGLASKDENAWWLVVFAGLSSAIHAIFFDYYQSEFISTVRSERSFVERETERFTDEIRQMKEKQRDGIEEFFLNLYLWYLGLQKRSSTKKQARNFNVETYRMENSGMIRLWSFLGPTTNRTMLISCAFFGHVEWFLWVVITVLNFWLLFCYVLQRKIHRRIAEEPREGFPTRKPPGNLRKV